MQTFSLVGIDHNVNGQDFQRQLCQVNADTLEEAARKLGGHLKDTRLAGHASVYDLIFLPKFPCGTFVCGDDTRSTYIKAIDAIRSYRPVVSRMVAASLLEGCKLLVLGQVPSIT